MLHLVRMYGGDLKLQHSHDQQFGLYDRVSHTPVLIAKIERLGASVKSIVGHVHHVSYFERVVLDFAGQIKASRGYQLEKTKLVAQLLSHKMLKYATTIVESAADVVRSYIMVVSLRRCLLYKSVIRRRCGRYRQRMSFQL